MWYKQRQMTDKVIGYIVMIILLTTIMFQQQLTLASPKDGTNNQTVISHTTKSSSELPPIPEEQPNDNVVNCAALGCPGNPPNPHGPPTEEPEGDE
jgi:hypothetical protein